MSMAVLASISASRTRGPAATENDELTVEFPDITATTWFSRRDLIIPDGALAKVAWAGQHLHRMMIPDESVPDLLQWGFNISYARIISQDIKELRKRMVKATPGE